MTTQQLEIYMDLDHTALDTAGLKQDLAESLVQSGVSPEAFFTAYRKVRQNGSFSIMRLVEALGVSPEKREEVTARLQERAAQCGRFLYSDVLPFLEKAKAHRARRVLFTYGDAEVQRLKLTGLGELTARVEEVVITTDGDKLLPKPPSGTRHVVIDDRPEVLERYVDVKGVVPVLVVRAGIERQPSRLRAYRSLAEVAEMLSKEGLW